ncbi:MAG: hypothetical protein WCO07_02955 [bacterium]
MDPESKKLLQDTFALAEDNNNMLHKIRRGQKWANFTRMVYWLIIIGISVGAFYFLQPQIEQMQSLIKSTGATFDQFKNLVPTSR